nr:MAG TPA: hypothetical protein [Caudoviricetes sp.]
MNSFHRNRSKILLRWNTWISVKNFCSFPKKSRHGFIRFPRRWHRIVGRW